MANKNFLEEYPLYRKFFELPRINRWTNVQDLPKPAIHMFCDACESDQTFNMVNEYHEVDRLFSESILNQTVRAKYVCSACSRGERIFLIHFAEKTRKHTDPETGEEEESDDLYVMKVGQIPSWSIEMDKKLGEELGGHTELYKRGLINESQGYGIGAFAYYRRITETIIDQLLDSISDLLEGEEKEKYEIALAETKKTIVTQEKIDLVKDLLPASLRPDGMNPLSVLHSALSEGLHAETDEDCLDYAEEIKHVLVYLVNQIERSKSSSKSFTTSMRKILDKRSGKQEKT